MTIWVVRRLALVCLVPMGLLLALWAGPVQGIPQSEPQSPPQPGGPSVGTAERPFVDTVDVRLVQVEAVVTDAEGERVHGLGAEDFQLLVDGEEVALEVFEEIRRGVTVTEGSRTVTAEGGEPDPAPTGRSILVFVDDFFTERATRRRLLGNLAKNLDTLGPGDRMAIVRFAGLGLEIRSEWTSSRKELERVISELRGDTPSELVRYSEVTAANDRTFDVMDPILTDLKATEQIRQAIGAMAAAMRAFSDAPGRKLLVPVTTGWQFDALRGVTNPTVLNTAELGREANNLAGPAPGLAALNAGGDTGGGAGTGSRMAEVMGIYGDHLLAPLVDAANLLGYTIYPMHLGRSLTNEVPRTSLWLVAKETGGRIATEGAANTMPLLPVVADTGSYYVLGFTPERAFDDRRHTVEVTVRRPRGATVRHRGSFLDLSHETRSRLKLEEALLLGRSGGDLDVDLGEPLHRRGQIQLPLTLHIPMDWVSVLPQGQDGEVFAADLELRVVAMDGDGQRSETTVVPLRLSGPEPEPGSVALYELAVDLRDREGQRLVLYLVDRLSGASKARVIEPTS